MNTHSTKIVGLAVCLAAGQVFGQGAVTNEINVVSPASADQGATGQLVTFTLDSDFPPAPPAGVLPASVTIGGISGTSVTHAAQYTVTALFDIPIGEPIGTKDATITWIPPQGGTVTFSKAAGLTVTAGADTPPTITSDPPARAVAPGGTATFTVAASGSTPMSYQWQKDEVNLGAPSTEASYTIASATEDDVGDYRCIVSNDFGSATSGSAALTVDSNLAGGYPVVDTGQTTCYGASGIITPPAPGAAFYGQDAQIAGNQPSYTTSGDGLTVTDNVTGLAWQQSPERTGDSTIDSSDKITWAAIPAHVASLNAASFGGYNDWRLPTIKELYSLVDFRGTDPSGYSGTDTSGLVPYIDPAYFDFGFGDTAAGERVIDAQYWSSNEYVSTTMGGDATVFGFNFADGRIKGYPRDTGPGGSANTMYLRLVRGNTSYGINQFADNGNNTVSDHATGLMWQQADSGSGMNWQQALAWVQTKNAESHLGFSDWRLPDAKELQTIFDYTRSPATTGTAAIDPVFSCTPITAENGASDFPFYWSGTTHATWNGNGGWGVYHCFGTAFGYVGSSWIDVHGAGAQRSDPKFDDGTDYSSGHGPQGDCVRIDNFVRLVRTSLPADDSVGDGIPDAWRREHFGGTGTTTDSSSAAGADPDGDGCNNLCEYIADTDPNDPQSRFAAAGSEITGGFALSFQSSGERVYTLWRSIDMSQGSWEQVAGQTGLPGSGGLDTLVDSAPPAGSCFYQVAVAVP